MNMRLHYFTVAQVCLVSGAGFIAAQFSLFYLVMGIFLFGEGIFFAILATTKKS